MARIRIPENIRQAVLRQDKYTCQYCGKIPVNSSLHVDHIIPVAHGGTNDIRNLCAACDKCNSGKSAAMLPITHEVMRTRRYLWMDWFIAKIHSKFPENSLGLIREFLFEITLFVDFKTLHNSIMRSKSYIEFTDDMKFIRYFVTPHPEELLA